MIRLFEDLLRKAGMVVKKIVTYILLSLIVLFFGITLTGFMIKAKSIGRIAPGITLCGQDISGMTMDEVEKTVKAWMPEFVTELRCPFLPEMQGEVEVAVKEQMGKEEGVLRVLKGELYLRTEMPMVRMVTEDTLQAVAIRSSEVKVWEWLYAKVTGTPFCIRPVEGVYVWEEAQFKELLFIVTGFLERDSVEAGIRWENGKIKVTESRRGFCVAEEEVWKEAENVMTRVRECLKKERVKSMVLRFYLKGKAVLPKLSTAQAKECNTKLGEFVTGYSGAGTGRAKNIETGAAHLHGELILPGEEFSTAVTLMPFTEKNGYAAGGTYIDGQLGESIGGGVCQLSTTLYNALLQTRLDISMRYPHSMPVGYVPLGRDAAIAGDYKDLRFVNNTEAPVLLLCEAVEENVKVTLYGAGEARRAEVTIESVVTEKTEESVIVEVYRTEKGEKGETVRERVSRDRYKEK